MSRHTMSVYQVSVKVPWGDVVAFGEAFDDGTSLVDAIVECLEQAAAAPDEDGDEDSTMRVVEVFAPDDDSPDVVAAMCETGNAGVSSRIADDGGEELFRRLPDHVEFQRALAILKLPPLRQKGLLVTHSPNNRGIKGDLVTLLTRYVRERGRVLKVDHLAPADAWQQLAGEGSLKALRWVKYVRTGDAADTANEALAEKNIGTIELVHHARRGLPMARKQVEDYLSNDITKDTLLAVEGVDIDFDSVKAVVQLGDRRQRTVNITTERVPRMEYDVTEDLEFSEDDGAPIYASLREQALELIDEFFANPAWGDGQT